MTSDYTSSEYIKRLVLETSDSPEQVQTFYKDNLGKDGWRVDKVYEPETPYSIYFAWRDPAYKSGYSFDLVIRSNDTGETRIEIKVVAHLCI